MKILRLKIKKFSLFSALMLALLLSTTKAFTLEDAIIAVVNDELITLKELRDYIKETYLALTAEGVDQTKIKEIMLDLEINGINKLIEDKLVLSKANSIGVEIRDKAVEERINEIKKKYPSEQIFLEALEASGGTLSDLQEKIKEQMKIQFIINHEVNSKIYINPKDVTKYYNEHIDQFKKKEYVKLESIFISYLKGRTAAYEKATEALNFIREPEDFEKIAKKYSETPSIGKVERGQLLPEVEEAIFNLKINEVSSLIEVNNGIYIFKLIDKVSSSTASIADVKDSIRDILFQEKFKDRLTSWLEKLKKEAYIEIKK
ncbi:MAG: peptidyl-prolyl cis-trans isomerase [Candidatus Omnitrophica bacterium]|nr:peptidyl-prolyl cis-trans isomerase [Candidatus Omnitrophota bacterium]